ncbi:DUF5819 family protein [Luteipulveratus mongoliensis]|uniref:Uncharacterized protein n=1 Tax=Luteipulveratus mongoliensis TaxID=571913 RepID=A0A0K1JF85_9MICO|nr:DUF5819 family protein [Luteipulveratus mongoliensis]AKU15387.1 hypothetical protein VV02_05090 [Luteipulveratus mongoliensis]
MTSTDMRRQRIAGVLLALIAAHLAATALYVARPLPLPAPARGVLTAYMEPVFKQTWSVFAPDPVSVNTSLLVRGRTADGRVTPWFDVSACDVDSAIRHHSVPNRRYLTTFQLVKHYRGSYADLPAAAARFGKNDRAMSAFAGQVATARWGRVDATQVRIRDTHTVPFADRDRPDASPRVETWTSGWRTAHAVGKQEQKPVSDLYGTTRCTP